MKKACTTGKGTAMPRGELKLGKLADQLRTIERAIERMAYRIQRYDGDGLEHAQLICLRKTSSVMLMTARQLKHFVLAWKKCK